MDLDETLRLATRITGWMVPEELAWLYQTAQRLPERASWLEIGVYAGRSLFATAMGLPRDCWLWGVDRELGTISDEILRTHRAILYHRPDIKLVLCRSESVALARHFADQTLDVVFVDGDHQYWGTRHDIEAWRRTVKLHGLLCGHDYNLPVHPGVVEAVNELGGTQVHHSIWTFPILPPPPPELLKIEEIVVESVQSLKTDSVSLDERAEDGPQREFPGYS